MAIFELAPDALRPLATTLLESEGVLERRDLQRLLRTNVGVIAPGTMVLTEEFGDWADSRRRIDLLAIDHDANLVVIELKRSDDAAMELQALRYAAMVAPMTFDQAVAVHEDFRAKMALPGGAREAIMEFLGWDEPGEFGTDQKIVLAAADFSKELTTAVIWLNGRGIDISCVRMKPYKFEGKLLLDVQQVIPLPEAAGYQVSLRDKEQVQRQEATRHSERRNFWTALLAHARTRTSLHANISPSADNWLSATSGKSWAGWSYITRQHDSHVELWLQMPSREQTKAAFDRIRAHAPEIEAEFGSALDWQRMDDNKMSKIRSLLPIGGYRDPQERWPNIHAAMVDAMIRLESVLGPHLGNVSA